MKINSIDHISYAVTDIDKVTEAWSRLYGLGPWRFMENAGKDVKGRPWKIRMAFAYVGPMEIELVQCVEGRIFQSKFLDKWGEGVHHIGLWMMSMPKSRPWQKTAPMFSSMIRDVLPTWMPEGRAAPSSS